MREERGLFINVNNLTEMKLESFLNPDLKISFSVNDDGDFPTPKSTDSSDESPTSVSSSNQTYPFEKSPWFSHFEYAVPQNPLLGSIVRKEGHVYSLATSGDLLYTGSDSKNIRVWKNLQEFTGFKSSSGLVKAIIISGEKIFTGHQDGKIRVWKAETGIHRRTGTLPTIKDVLKSSMNRRSPRIKHSDAVSCLSLSEDKTILYSSSWDRTMKVWRISDSKCLESVTVHDDAVNSIVGSPGGLVFTGSADGTAKVWRREYKGTDATEHTLVQILTKQEYAVTALAVDVSGSVVYSGSSDGLVNFWEREKRWSYGGVLKGHKLAILCLTAAGKNMILSGSADKTICVWRREGLFHTCVAVLTGHTGPVKCLAVEEDCRSSENGERQWIVYSGSLDSSVKVWGVGDGVVEC